MCCSFSTSPSIEYSGLISFRIDLFAVQGTLKSLLQHHNSKASILQCSVFFMVQLSHPYMITGKTHALSCSVMSDSVTPWTVARQVPLSMGILQVRILEWVAMPSSRALPNPGIEPRSPELQADSLPSKSPGKQKNQ